MYNYSGHCQCVQLYHSVTPRSETHIKLVMGDYIAELGGDGRAQESGELPGLDLPAADARTQSGISHGSQSKRAITNLVNPWLITSLLERLCFGFGNLAFDYPTPHSVPY